MKASVRTRAGSALLIVIGMLAFMLFSGLAFSVYMRATRMPSSFLRRTVSSRQLAKAAVAEAIEELDLALANDRHPNIRTGGRSADQKRVKCERDFDGNAYETGKRALGNYWSHRVFVGKDFTGSDGSTYTPKEVWERAESETGQSSGDAKGGYVTPEDVVSVLSLEAMAYVPAPLFNDIRFMAQHTPTAKWDAFAFDSGRYAYVALDVSDYFDVNRLMADKPRNSGGRRVTLAHVFENEKHTSAGSGMAAWDTFMAQTRSVDDSTGVMTWNDAPFVSWADFNLMLGAGGQGKLKSPFANFIADNGKMDNEEDQIYYRQMTFMTDGWYPVRENQKTEDGDEILDLADGANQPFTKSQLESANIMSTMNFQGTKLLQRLDENFLCRLGHAQLADYLDPDPIPVSLALPTTERVPMVCGIKPEFQQAKVKVGRIIEESAENEQVKVISEEGNERIVERTEYFTVEPQLGIPMLQILTVYPFHHADSVTRTFSVEGRYYLFYTAGDAGENGEIALRTSTQNEMLQYGHYKTGGAASFQDGIVSIPLQGQSPALPSPGDEAAQCVSKLALNGAVANEATGQFAKKENAIVKLRRRWRQKPEDPDAEVKTWIPKDPPDDLKSELMVESEVTGGSANTIVYDKDGNAVKANQIQSLVEAGKSLHVNFAVSVAVKESGDTVDLVPATVADDEALNGKNSGPGQLLAQQINGTGTPLVKFPFSLEVNLSLSSLQKAAEKGEDQELALVHPVALIGDPRFNHDPDSWFATDADNFTEEKWVQNCGADSTDEGRDGDIFLSVSDQGYLQSIYELSFLMRLTNPWGNGGDFCKNEVSGNLENPRSNRRMVTNRKNAHNHAFMWKSYRPYESGGQTADDFERLGVVSGDSAMKVNPYSDTTNVLMAAFANTPVSWRMATTNAQNVSELAIPEDPMKMTAQTFNEKYAWNGYDAPKDSCLEWEDLNALAVKFIDQVNREGKDWEDVWCDLWDNASGDYLVNGVELSDSSAELRAVDRRFLYGYWHDCFAAKQQLFLVFVRAEPAMMGGGVANMQPPQLGAKAVALVWRDPRATREVDRSEGQGETETALPHRTRMLFYHPFE